MSGLSPHARFWIQNGRRVHYEESYLLLSGVQHQSVPERLRLTTSQPHDEAMQCEMAAFLAWLQRHLLTTFKQAQTTPSLQWMRLNHPSFNNSDEYVVQPILSFSLYTVFRRSARQGPISCPIMAEMLILEHAMINELMQLRKTAELTPVERLAAAQAVLYAGASKRQRCVREWAAQLTVKNAAAARKQQAALMTADKENHDPDEQDWHSDTTSIDSRAACNKERLTSKLSRASVKRKAVKPARQEGKRVRASSDGCIYKD